MEARNAGLSPRHPDELTLVGRGGGWTHDEISEQILSRHVRRRIADATQNETSTPMDAHGAPHISEATVTVAIHNKP